MRYILCALAIVIAGLPAPVFAADAPSNEQLRKRLQDLDRRIDRLEHREKRETRAENRAERRADAKAGAAAPKEPTKADWAKVGIGMEMVQVRKILGEPLRTRTTAEHTILSWHPVSVPGGEIWFRDTTAERVFPPRQ